MSARLLQVSLPVVALFTAAVIWAQTSLRPGQYEIVSEIRMPGEPTATHHTDLECVTAEDAADVESALLDLASDDMCEASNVVSRPGKMTFDTNCDGIATHADIDYTSESIRFVLTMTIDGQTATSTSEAKWVGAMCTVDGE